MITTKLVLYWPRAEFAIVAHRKAGSTTFRRAFSGYEIVTPEDLPPGVRVHSVLREPLYRLMSVWRDKIRATETTPDRWYQCEEFNEAPPASFPEFVRRVCEIVHSGEACDEHYLPQSDLISRACQFLHDRPVNLELYPFTEFEEAFRKIEAEYRARTGRSARYRHSNKTRGGDLRLDEILRDEVRRAYWLDYHLYGELVGWIKSPAILRPTP